MQYGANGDPSGLVDAALRNELVKRLKQAQVQLQSEGVLHASIFGSVARCEADPESDVDILVDLGPGAKIDLFQFVGLQQLLEKIMEREVDLVSRKGLRPGRHDSILADAIEVF